MGKILFNPKIENKLYKELNKLKYNDYYQSLYCYEFDKTEPKGPEFLDTKTNKCAFCGKGIDEVSFTNKAHILPAFFGNPKLFSKEECNICNHKFGDDFENELSKMLSPYLISGNIKPRKGLSRKSKSNNTSIELKLNQGIFVKTNENIDIDSEEGKVTVPFPMEKFNIQKALRSLLHSFWLIIDDKERAKLQWILKALNNINYKIPTENYIGFAQSESNIIRFQVFKKLKDNNIISEFILKIKFGDYFIYYPINYKPIFKPILIESFIIDESNNSIPTLSFRKFNKDIIESQTVDITFNFEGYRDSISNQFKKIKKVNKKMISIFINEKKIVNQTYLKFYENGKIVIEDLDLCLNLTSEKNEFTYNLKLENQNINKIKKSIDFINCLNQNKNAKIYTLSGHQFICDLIFNSLNSIKIDKYFEIFINNLFTISTELNRTFIYKNPLKKMDIINTNRLLSIINYNETNEPLIKISSNDNDIIKGFHNELINFDNLEINYNNEQIKIFNQTLNLADIFQYNIKGIKNIEIEDNVIIISAAEFTTQIK